jgi:hypothetical protein
VKRWLIRIVIAGVALFVVAQVVPYGRNHTNPTANAEPSWVGAQTRALAARSCFDCHSNLTTWPWYSNVAPVSWLVYADVKGGREQFNFSEWNRPQDVSAGDIAEAVSGGSMPPLQYLLLHRKAKLSSADKKTLAAGLAATITQSPPGR